MDYTTFPEGFQALLEKLNLPVDTEDREAALLQILKQLMDM